MLATDTLEVTNKVGVEFLQKDGVPTKITNLLFLNDVILCILTIDNEIVLLNCLKNEIMYRKKIENMRYYEGQMILSNDKVIMNKMNKLMIVKGTIS